MAHEALLTAFVIVAALAILLQAVAMAGIWRAVQNIQRQVEAVRVDVKQRLDPLTQSITEIVADSREPLRNLAANLEEISRMLRDRTSHVESLVADLVDKSRLQMIRVDQLVSDLVRRVENTADVVQRNVLGPIQEVSAVVKGFRSGLEFFFSRRRPPSVSEVTQDEQMFI